LAELVLKNKGLVTCNDSLNAELQMEKPFTGKAMLRVTWSDSYGRTILDKNTQVQIDGNKLSIQLPLEEAVAMQNFLELELQTENFSVKIPRTEFIVTPKTQKLDDYNIIMYNAYQPKFQNNLKDIGITAGQLQPENKLSGDIATSQMAREWWENNFQYYCDQISIPFYAAYHAPGYVPKHKLLLEAKEAYRNDRTNKEVFIRKPSFHDIDARAAALDKIRRTVEANMRFKPLMYTTDETSVTDLVTPWDFDFDPRALAAMRDWLIEEYGSLDAINKQWGTSFSCINEVVPFTTDEMFARGDDNLSPWADHRFFMNKTFSDVIKAATDAAHSVDSDAISGVVGCQMPAAFGGYDYWLLSRAMDMVEPYNIGNNREIWRSLAPEKPAFTTSFGNDKLYVLAYSYARSFSKSSIPPLNISTASTLRGNSLIISI